MNLDPVTETPNFKDHDTGFVMMQNTCRNIKEREQKKTEDSFLSFITCKHISPELQTKLAALASQHLSGEQHTEQILTAAGVQLYRKKAPLTALGKQA